MDQAFNLKIDKLLRAYLDYLVDKVRRGEISPLSREEEIILLNFVHFIKGVDL